MPTESELLERVNQFNVPGRPDMRVAKLTSPFAIDDPADRWVVTSVWHWARSRDPRCRGEVIMTRDDALTLADKIAAEGPINV